MAGKGNTNGLPPSSLYQLTPKTEAKQSRYGDQFTAIVFASIKTEDKKKTQSMARLHSVGRTLMKVFRPKSSDKSSVIPAMKYKNSKWFKKKYIYIYTHMPRGHTKSD